MKQFSEKLPIFLLFINPTKVNQQNPKQTQPYAAECENLSFIVRRRICLTSVVHIVFLASLYK